MSEIQKVSSDFVKLFEQDDFTAKLDAKIFEAFLNENKGLKDQLREAVKLIVDLKEKYEKFADTQLEKKGSLEKKPSKQDQAGGKGASGDASSGSSTKLSDSDIKLQLESLRKDQVKTIRGSFVFSSMENISKNLSLFDDFFLRKKQELEHTKNMSMLSMIANIGFDQAGAVNLSPEQKASNNENQKSKKANAKCLNELNKRKKFLFDQLSIARYDRVGGVPSRVRSQRRRRTH